MPRGRSRCGFLVSSAVVATTSNPMKAKNTRDAAASRPNTPYVLVSTPNTNDNKDWSSPEPPPSALPWAGGMNGE